MANLTKVKGSVETALKKLALLIGATLVGTSTGKTVQEVLDDMDARMDGIDDVQAKTLGMYIGQTVWHNYRPVIPGGLIPLDGQQLDVTAGGVMVGLHDAAVAGLLPVTTEALWQSDPTKRNCYVIDVSGKIRLPDMNGALPDSIKQPSVAGDNGSLQGQMQKGGVPNIKGSINNTTDGTGYGFVLSNAARSGVFDVAPSPNLLGLSGNSAVTTARTLTFSADRSSDLYVEGLAEVRTNRAVGCWCVVAFGGASDLTGFDPATLASRIEAVYSQCNARLVTIEGRKDYAKIETTGVVGLNVRQVFPNPFGNDTPVFCQAEAFHATLNKWVASPWIWTGSNPAGYGFTTFYAEGEGIVLRTAPTGLLATANACGASQEVPTNYSTPSLFRIHVYRAFGS